MGINDTRSTETSTSNAGSVFYCPEVPLNFTWDLNTSNFAWFLVAIRCIASPCTILINILLIVAVSKNKALQKPSTVLISSMAVTDLLIGSLCMPSTVTVDVLIFRRVSFSHICALDSFNIWLTDFLTSCSLYHLTAIAWERYVAIQKWMDYKIIVTTSRVKMLATACWLLTISITVPALIMRLTGVDHKVVEIWHAAASAPGGISLILLVYFYVMVYLGVRKRKVDEISQVTAVVKAKLESKVAKTTGLLTAVVIFSFVPMGVVLIFGNIFPFLRTNSVFRTMDTLSQLNSVLNPILYSYRDRRFRNALLGILRMRKPQAPQPTVGAMQAVRRKAPQDSLKNAPKTSKDTKPTHLRRSKSCYLDCALQIETVSKRSMSAPALYHGCLKYQLLRHHRQQPSSMPPTTTIINVDCGVRYKERESNRAFKVRKNELQGTSHLNRNLSRSKSWDAGVALEFGNHCGANSPDRTVGRSQSAPCFAMSVFFPAEDGALTDTGFTTRM